MDITQLYEALPATEGISDEQTALLARIMNLENPVDFDFATDEEMDALENALDRAEREVPQSMRFKEVVASLRAKVSESEPDFV